MFYYAYDDKEKRNVVGALTDEEFLLAGRARHIHIGSEYGEKKGSWDENGCLYPGDNPYVGAEIGGVDKNGCIYRGRPRAVYGNEPEWNYSDCVGYAKNGIVYAGDSCDRAHIIGSYDGPDVVGAAFLLLFWDGMTFPYKIEANYTYSKGGHASSNNRKPKKKRTLAEAQASKEFPKIYYYAGVLLFSIVMGMEAYRQVMRLNIIGVLLLLVVGMLAGAFIGGTMDDYYKRCKADREFVKYASERYSPKNMAEQCFAMIQSVKNGKTYSSVSNIQFIFEDKVVHMYVEGKKASDPADSENKKEEIWTGSITEVVSWVSPSAKDYEEPKLDLIVFIPEVARIINQKGTFQVQQSGQSLVVKNPV